MATLAISIDLTQVREASQNFHQLLEKMKSSAISVVEKIHSEFNRRPAFVGLEKGVDRLLDIMAKYEEVINVSMKVILGYFKQRPNLEEFRISLRSFKTIMAEFRNEGALTAKAVADSLKGAKLQAFSPTVDLDKINKGRQTMHQYMDSYVRLTERATTRMEKSWQHLGNVVANSLGKMGQAIRVIKAEILALGALSNVLQTLVTLMTQLASAGANLNANRPRFNVNQIFAGNIGPGASVGIGPNVGAVTNRNYTPNVNQAQNQINSMNASLAHSHQTLLGLFFLIDKLTFAHLVEGVKSFLSSVIDTQVQLDRMRSLLGVGFAGNQKQVTIEMERISQVAEQLGLDVASATEEYGRLTAAARESGLQGEGVFRLWRGAAMAAKATGADTERVFRAFVDMISKNRVQNEELVKQLGQGLPGGVKLAETAVKSLGKNMEDLRSGNISVTQFLLQFSKVMEDVFGPQALTNANNMSSGINRLSNAWFELKRAVAETGFSDALIRGMAEITRQLREPETVEAFQRMGNALGHMLPRAINALIPLLELLAKHLDTVVNLATTASLAFSGIMTGGLMGMALSPFMGPGAVLGGMAIGGGLGVLGGQFLSSAFSSGFNEPIPGVSQYANIPNEIEKVFTQRINWGSVIGNPVSAAISFALHKLLRLVGLAKTEQVPMPIESQLEGSGFAAEGTDQDAITEEEKRAQKRFDSMVRRLSAQQDEYLEAVKIAEAFPTFSKEFDIATENAELIRRAKSEDVDITKKLAGEESTLADLIKETAEAKVLSSRITKTKTALDQMEAQQLDSKALAEATLSIGIRRHNEALASHVEFIRRKLELERAGEPLSKAQIARLNNSVEKQRLYNKQIEAATSLQKAYQDSLMITLAAEERRSILLQEEAKAIGEAAPQISEAHIDISKLGSNLAPAELLAITNAQRQAVLQFPGIRDMNIRDEETKAVVPMMDIITRNAARQYHADLQNSIVDTILRMKEQAAEQRDMVELFNLSADAREVEINQRKALRDLTSSGQKFVDQKDVDTVMALSKEITELRQKVRDLYTGETLSDSFEALRDIGTIVFRNLGRALEEFVEKGKFSFSSLVRSITADLLKLSINKAIMEPLENLLKNLSDVNTRKPGSNPTQAQRIQGSDWISKSLGLVGAGAGAVGSAGSGLWGTLGGLLKGIGGLFGGGGGINEAAIISYRGGIIGEDRLPSIYKPFPRYHYALGGIAGVDTIPAWLTRGEGVFTKAQMRNMVPLSTIAPMMSSDKEGRPMVINNNFDFSGSNPDSFRRSTAQMEARIVRSSQRASKRLGGE